MSSATPAGRIQQAWKNVFIGLLVIAAIIFFVGQLVFKAPWELLVPALFPGAVKQGLIAPTISWDSTFMLAIVLAMLFAALDCVLRFPRRTGPSARALDAKLDAIAKHLGIDLDEVIASELLALIKQGKKVEAIALYRDYAGAGLAEAKSHVESLERTG